MPRPAATPVRSTFDLGDGRASHFAAFATADTTSFSRASLRCRSRYAIGSAFTCAATSSMNDSCAKVFCRRDGDLRGVKRATGFEYIRFHGLLMDELGLYNEDAQ